MELSIVMTGLMKKDIFVVRFILTIKLKCSYCFLKKEQCHNNLYSCPPKDDIRCDLACKMLHYVPCQTIQDRRACQYIEKSGK